MKKILIIDDEKSSREGFARVLKAAGFSPVQAASGNEGIRALKKGGFSAIILDLMMPDMNGMEVMRKIKNIDPIVPFIFATGYGNIPNTVEAMKLGAHDFFAKPPDFDRLILSLNSAIEKMELRKEVQRLDTIVVSSLERILGNSETMTKMKKEVQRVAGSDFSVIIQGETGTGKTTLAREIHNLSKRSAKLFVKVDIGALTESLIESELFGHEKGAFTGADSKKKGFFEIADGGTLFLDEIGNMSLSAQTKLLQVLEDKCVYLVGSGQSLKVDIRFIAATHANIETLVSEKKMREDLYYRLSEFTITIPPLRERVEDIRFLAWKFFEEACDELNSSMNEISDEAMELLRRYQWPGNIRELKTVIRKAVLLSDQRIVNAECVTNLLGKKMSLMENPMVLPFKEAMKLREIEIINNALKMAKGNKTKAASMLKMSYRNFLAKIKDYGIKNQRV